MAVGTAIGEGVTRSLGLLIPRPGCETGAIFDPAPDIALGLAVVAGLCEPGVAGDSVPMRDFLAALRGVILPLRFVGAGVSRAGERARTKTSRRFAEAGELGPDATRRGVRGLLVFGRKLELSAGVMGFPLDCLSKGILGFAGCRGVGRCGWSSMTGRSAVTE